MNKKRDVTNTGPHSTSMIKKRDVTNTGPNQPFRCLDCSCQDTGQVNWRNLAFVIALLSHNRLCCHYYYITTSRSLQGQHDILPSYGSESNSLTHKCQVLISYSIALEHLHWSMPPNDDTNILTETDTETFFRYQIFRNRDFFSETKSSKTETETFF